MTDEGTLTLVSNFLLGTGRCDRAYEKVLLLLGVRVEPFGHNFLSNTTEI